MLTLTMLLVLQANQWVDAGCCDRCGATCSTQVVCRTVCTTKIEECNYFDEQCETICLPPKSLSVAGYVGSLTCDACGACASCDACDTDSCDSCDGCGGRATLLSGWAQLLGRPSQCHFRDRKQLMRKSYVEYVPKLECIVEELCAGCCGVSPQMLPGEELEPLPAPVVPPAASAGPVRLQITDQMQDPTPVLPPIVSADQVGEDGPTALQALAPIAPVDHSLNR
jgi:hypothetical protein